MWQIEQTQDVEHLRQAWQWYQRMPKSIQTTSGYKDIDVFMEESKKDLLVAGFNGKLQTVVQCEDIGSRAVEGHIYCCRHPNQDLIVATIMYAANACFEQDRADTLIAMVPSRHRFLKQLVTRAGFTANGMKMWKGQDLRGKIFETEMFIRMR